MELLVCVGIMILLLGATSRLWSGLGRRATTSPVEGARQLAAMVDAGVQTARNLGVPMAFAVAEAKGEAGAELHAMLLQARTRSTEDMAVGWPVNLGSTQHWQSAVPELRLAGLRLEPGFTSTAPVFHRRDAAGENRAWRLVAIVTPAGQWSTGLESHSTWALSPGTLEVGVADTLGDSPVVRMQLHPASSRSRVQLAE